MAGILREIEKQSGKVHLRIISVCKINHLWGPDRETFIFVSKLRETLLKQGH